MSKSSKKIGKQVKQIVEDTSFREARSDDDTIRVWENYREQALLWRGLTLLQLLVTFIAITFSIYLYANQTITLNVPEKPLPGYYEANQIPEAEFINFAEEFVNLIGTYQHMIAERQFKHAAEFLVEPILSKYEKDILDTELKLVRQTRRTQLYFINHEKTAVEYPGYNLAKVSFVGERIKTIAGKEQRPQLIRYTVTMTTVPRSKFNEYGIVIKNLELSKIEY